MTTMLQGLLYVADLSPAAREGLHDCIPPVLLVDVKRRSLYVDGDGPVVVAETVEKVFVKDHHGFIHWNHPDNPTSGNVYLRFQANLDAITMSPDSGL